MRMNKCPICGSSEFEVSKYRRKDFPAKFYFVDCKKCGAGQGVVDFCNIVDAYKSGTPSEKQLASAILTRRFEAAL